MYYCTRFYASTILRRLLTDSRNSCYFSCISYLRCHFNVDWLVSMALEDVLWPFEKNDVVKSVRGKIGTTTLTTWTFCISSAQVRVSCFKIVDLHSFGLTLFKGCQLIESQLRCCFFSLFQDSSCFKFCIQNLCKLTTVSWIIK